MTKVFLVSFELNNPESIKNRKAIERTIKKITGTWWHQIEAVWLVAGDESLSADTVYRKLTAVLKVTKEAAADGPDDDLLVIRVYPQERQGWLPTAAWKWLNKVSEALPRAVPPR